jgi:hypothetical protein
MGAGDTLDWPLEESRNPPRSNERRLLLVDDDPDEHARCYSELTDD